MGKHAIIVLAQTMAAKYTRNYGLGNRTSTNAGAWLICEGILHDDEVTKPLKKTQHRYLQSHVFGGGVYLWWDTC